MGVNPGKAGQKFQSNVVMSLYELKDWMEENNRKIPIEVDGGMDYNTIPMVISVSDYIVSGSFLAKNFNDLSGIIEWFNIIGK